MMDRQGSFEGQSSLESGSESTNQSLWVRRPVISKRMRRSTLLFHGSNSSSAFSTFFESAYFMSMSDCTSVFDSRSRSDITYFLEKFTALRYLGRNLTYYTSLEILLRAIMFQMSCSRLNRSSATLNFSYFANRDQQHRQHDLVKPLQHIDMMLAKKIQPKQLTLNSCRFSSRSVMAYLAYQLSTETSLQSSYFVWPYNLFTIS